MKAIHHILVFWIVIFRFLVNDDFSLAGNISALIINLFLINQYDSHVSKIALIITLSILYSSMVSGYIRPNISGIFGVIGAIITTFIVFNPLQLWKKWM
jgi:hypothetical protein